MYFQRILLICFALCPSSFGQEEGSHRGKLITPLQLNETSDYEGEDLTSSYSEVSVDQSAQYQVQKEQIPQGNIVQESNNQSTEEEEEYIPEQSYSIMGHYDREEEFVIFEGPFFQNTTKIHLKNIEIDAGSLIKELKGLSLLHTLILDNVKFINLERISRVFLPRLKSFYLHHVYDSNLWEVMNFGSKLQSLLFFDRKPASKWNVSQIWSLGVDITIKFDVIKVLEINHTEGRLTSSLKYSNELLKDIKSSDSKLSPPSKLSLRGVSIEPEVLPSNLTYLNLQFVQIPLEKLGETLGSSQSLTELSLTVEKSAQTSIDITALPLSLQKISLINFLRIEMNSEPQFNLSSLTLNECNFPRDYTYNFFRLSNVKKVALLGPCYKDSHNLLAEAIGTGAKSVFLTDFHRKAGSPLDLFLSSRGIPSNQLNLVLKNVHSSWLAKELFPEQSHKSKRDLSGLGDFFAQKYNLAKAQKALDPYFIKEMERRSQKIISLRGEAFELENLEQMNETERAEIGLIHLVEAEIPAALFPTVLATFPNLRHLIMEEVHVFGQYNSTNVSLPLLETFIYNEFYPDYKEMVLKGRELPQATLESILFFLPEGLSSARNCSIDIVVSIGGIKYLQIVHAKKELFSRVSYSSTIYGNNSLISSLILSGVNTVDVPQFPRNLTSLTLYSVNLTGTEGALQEHFSDFSQHLTNLYLFPAAQGENPDIYFDIGKLPKNLKNLVLRNVHLTSRRREQSLQLDTLAFYDCRFPSDFDTEIHRYFQISEGVGIFNSFYRKPQSPNHSLLFSLLQTEAKWIYVFSFDWDLLPAEEFEEFQSNIINSRLEIAEEIDEIVTSAGIKKGVKDFYLQRQNSNGKWTGNAVDLKGRLGLTEWIGMDF